MHMHTFQSLWERIHVNGKMFTAPSSRTGGGTFSTRHDENTQWPAMTHVSGLPL